jgi:hypothetical protein
LANVENQSKELEEDSKAELIIVKEKVQNEISLFTQDLNNKEETHKSFLQNSIASVTASLNEEI